MLDDFTTTGAEASTGTERPRQGPDNHVDFGRVHSLLLGDAPSCPAQDAKGPCLVEDEPELVAELELNLCTSLRSADV